MFEIDQGDVTLGVDLGYGVQGMMAVDLEDLPQADQIKLDKGVQVSAVCRVGDYIIGTIRMRDCELD